MKQVEVLLPAAVDHGFDYLAPAELALAAGDIVRVPFGRGESLGVVLGEGKAKLAEGKMKPVKEKLSFPALSESMRDFIAWAAWYNCASAGAVLKMVLPIDEPEKAGRTSVDTAINEAHLALAQLSDVQKLAAEQIEHKIGHGFSVTVLDGVTGSGKTEVYFDAVAHTLSADPKHQVLVLLPEIALSVQWLTRFEKRFGFTPLIWNSEITAAKKRATWQAIANGDARVIVGARSALFLPYRNLQLIVVDEEHDQSYKQEEGVIYHARDMAVARARFEKFPIVLVSATPSLETFYNARQGKYNEVTLRRRHADATMPEVEVLDMRSVEVERGNFISRPLREKLAQAIASGHQAMLFLNRRGYAPLVLCRSCGHRFQCAECSSWLVAHKNKPRLECHHCGFAQAIPKACPACGKEDCLHACGPGVERVLEEVTQFLPQARVSVMASDQLESYKELQDTINAMQDKKIDILIGTQMIAKGHHFAGLALVGVVDADLGLSGGDLRAAERTYQLLHQLSGRAGRETVQGKVYLQSYLPEHPVMQALISGDREAFLQAELTARENGHMPPFSRLAAIIVEGEKEPQVIATAKQLAANFSPLSGGRSRGGSHASADPHPALPLAGGGISLLGPAPAPLYMLRGKYRMRLLVKADRNVNLPDFIKNWVDSVKAPSNVRVKIDIDPVGFL